MCSAAVLCLNGISPSLHLLTYVTLFTLLPSYKLCSLNMAMSVHIDVSSYVYYIIMFPLPWPWHCTVYSLPGIHRQSFHQRFIFIKHYLSRHWKNLGVVTGFDLLARRHKMESQNPAILARNNNKTTKNKNRLFFSVIDYTQDNNLWTRLNKFLPCENPMHTGYFSTPTLCARAYMRVHSCKACLLPLLQYFIFGKSHLPACIHSWTLGIAPWHVNHTLLSQVPGRVYSALSHSTRFTSLATSFNLSHLTPVHPKP